MRRWIEGDWPNYRSLDRTRRVGRGMVQAEVNPFAFPWPQLSMYQRGDSVSLGLALGPSGGPDPLLQLWLEIPRPGSS